MGYCILFFIYFFVIFGSRDQLAYGPNKLGKLANLLELKQMLESVLRCRLQQGSRMSQKKGPGKIVNNYICSKKTTFAIVWAQLSRAVQRILPKQA